MQEFTEQQQQMIDLEARILSQADALTKSTTALLLAVETGKDTIVEQDAVSTLMTSQMQALRTMQALADTLAGKPSTFTLTTREGKPVEVEVREKAVYQRALFVGGKEVTLNTTRSPYMVRLETDEETFTISPQEYMKIGPSPRGDTSGAWASAYGIQIALLEQITNVVTHYSL